MLLCHKLQLSHYIHLLLLEFSLLEAKLCSSNTDLFITDVFQVAINETSVTFFNPGNTMWIMKGGENK